MTPTKTMTIEEYCEDHYQWQAAEQTGLSQGYISLACTGKRQSFHVTVAHDGKTIVNAYRFQPIGRFQEKHTGQDS